MKTMEVWNCGGGTQSIAIAVLIIQRKLPAPDFSLIVDTGREKRSTWEYYDNTLSPALREVGIILKRVSKKDFATVDLWSKNGQSCELPAFTTQTEGEIGKMSNFCSHEWKTRVAHRYLRSLGVGQYRKRLGFSTDEPRRYAKKLNDLAFRIPLVQDIPMNRQECVDLVKSVGWPEPPRSSCWMCPNHHDKDWQHLKENSPEEFAAAVRLEKELQQKDPFIWLHVDGIPLDQVDFQKPPKDKKRPASQCASGECFT